MSRPARLAIQLASGVEGPAMNVTASVAEAPDSLAIALIASSHSPLILLGGDLHIVAASQSFCAAFKVDPDAVVGVALSELGRGEWKDPQLDSLLKSALAGRADLIDGYEFDLKRPGRETRHLILHVHKLLYGDKENVRLLLAVSDVTAARFDQRFTENVMREKSILLEELQHRVANSLQIIAGVLMQSARRVASDETRRHLHDAHSRVMSVASLQHHLAVTGQADVELRSYLVELCKCIAASMIHDPDQLSLEVRASPCVTAADASMSLGLIVTELVINAIKHGFPDRRQGKIIVAHQAKGTAWTLSVADDGIGMPSDPASAVAGLGSSLIHALANQLGAEITIVDVKPGTLVRVTHGGVNSPKDEPGAV
jgi:two-component sensor histidine kinase